MSMAARYRLVATLTGLAAAWVPYVLHGPIPAKLDRVRLNGAIVVWAWYAARMLIGFVVACTTWPPAWWIRGPLFGVLVLLPCGLFSLGTPGCGPNCMMLNLSTAAAIGLVAAGAARLATGRSHACA
jgi:hypothetical protein